MGNRDFKGVWIPKEIWLNPELTMYDKVIFTEISSLDNEDHCTASNEYLSEFCGCSERKISESIKKLIEMGYIEQVSFNGRQRILRVANSAMESSKICESPSQNLRTNNIENKRDIKGSIIDNTEGISEFESHAYSPKESKDEFIGSIGKKPARKKRKSLYEKCVDEIYAYTKSLKLQDTLCRYLTVRLAIKEKPMYGVNQWVGLLNRLSKTEGDPVSIVEQSIERGWCSFYPLSEKGGKPKDVSNEGGKVTCHNQDDIEDKEEYWSNESF